MQFCETTGSVTPVRSIVAYPTEPCCPCPPPHLSKGPAIAAFPPYPRSTKHCDSWACTLVQRGGRQWRERAPLARFVPTCSPRRSGRACAANESRDSGTAETLSFAVDLHCQL